jgi:hypothetical protein
MGVVVGRTMAGTPQCVVVVWRKPLALCPAIVRSLLQRDSGQCAANLRISLQTL